MKEVERKEIFSLSDMETTHYWLVKRMRVISSFQFCVLCEIFRSFDKNQEGPTFYALQKFFTARCPHPCFIKEEDRKDRWGLSSVENAVKALVRKGFVHGDPGSKGVRPHNRYVPKTLAYVQFERLPEIGIEQPTKEVIMLKVLRAHKGEREALFVREHGAPYPDKWGMPADYFLPELGDVTHIDTVSRVARKYNLSFHPKREETWAKRAAQSPLVDGVAGVIIPWSGVYRGGHPDQKYAPLWLKENKIEASRENGWKTIRGAEIPPIRESSQQIALLNLRRRSRW